jgi:opacity protein-like surface antigen
MAVVPLLLVTSAHATDRQGADLPKDAASAPGQGGFYFGAKGGLVDFSDAALRTTIAPPGNGGTTTQSVVAYGFTAAGVLGYDTGQRFGYFGLRGEFEVGYMRPDLSTVAVDMSNFNVMAAMNGINQQVTVTYGPTSSIYGMANGYIDAHLGWFKPYLSAGVGVGHTSVENQGAGGNPAPSDGAKTHLVYQVGVGAGIDINERMMLDIGYRYMNLGAVGVAASTQTRTVDMVSNQVLLGLRHRF